MYRHKSGAIKRKRKREREEREKKGQRRLESLGFNLISQVENQGEMSDTENNNSDSSDSQLLNQNLPGCSGQDNHDLEEPDISDNETEHPGAFDIGTMEHLSQS